MDIWQEKNEEEGVPVETLNLDGFTVLDGAREGDCLWSVAGWNWWGVV